MCCLTTGIARSQSQQTTKSLRFCMINSTHVCANKFNFYHLLGNYKNMNQHVNTCCQYSSSLLNKKTKNKNKNKNKNKKKTKTKLKKKLLHRELYSISNWH